MDAARLIDRLERFPPVLRALCAMASQEDVRWKPSPTDWSILEVACHLADEEREDFPFRLRSTLEDPSRTWPPLDLNGVAESRRYNEQDLGTTLEAFAACRRENMAWLRSLPAEVNWSTAYTHPKVGDLHAGMLLASWAAHDALHARQVAKRLHGMALRDGDPYSIVYAGEW